MKLVSQLGESAPGPCPALTQQDDKYLCGLVLYPKKYLKSIHSTEKLSKAIKQVIGAGRGCDELLENDTEEEENKLSALLTELMSDPEFVGNAVKAKKILYNK